MATGPYLDEGLHIAVKQLTVKNGARSTLPDSVGLRGQSGGPGETTRIHGGFQVKQHPKQDQTFLNDSLIIKVRQVTNVHLKFYKILFHLSNNS